MVSNRCLQGQFSKKVEKLWELLFKKRCTMVNNNIFLKKEVPKGLQVVSPYLVGILQLKCVGIPLNLIFFKLFTIFQCKSVFQNQICLKVVCNGSIFLKKLLLRQRKGLKGPYVDVTEIQKLLSECNNSCEARVLHSESKLHSSQQRNWAKPSCSVDLRLLFR